MSQVVTVLWWWVLVVAIGLLAWPLAFRLLRFVPDRGYSAARPMGLLLGTYAWWLLGSLGFLNTSLGSIVVALALVGSLAGWIYHERRPNDTSSLTNWLRENSSYVLTYETLFLIAFTGWAYFRAHSPGISHTEKPMEFAFLNAILRSPGFPPNDPWLSGYSISYYYMGYVMMALLTRISGTTPGIAYNVAHALWFALFAAGAFGAAHNLISDLQSPISNLQSPISNIQYPTSNPKALIYGLLAAVMLVVMGNLAGALEMAHQNSIGLPGFWRWLDIAELSGPATSGGGLTPQRGDWWWWRASRVINDYKLNGNSQHNDTTVIDEFPQFSFILGDMHPHVLTIPFALLTVLLAFNLYRSDFRFTIYDLRFTIYGQRPTTNQQPATSNQQLSTFLLYALMVGALGFLNTWDYPFYLALVVAAYGLRHWLEEGKLSSSAVLEAGLLGASLGLTGFVLYLPFYLSLESQARGLLPNLFNGTRFSQFFVMFGPFLTIGACFILALASRIRRQVWFSVAGWTLVILAACLVLTLAIGFISPEGRTYLSAWLQDEPLPGLEPGTGDVVISRLVGRLLGTSTPTPRPDGSIRQVPGSGPWVPLALIGTIVVILLTWHESFSQSPNLPISQSPYSPSTAVPERDSTRLAPPTSFVLLLFATGASLALSVEFVFLADAFDTRMNTVFKFYYQAWMLWSIASAYGAYYIIDSTDNKQGAITRIVQASLIAMLILAGLAYPVMAIPSRTGQGTSPTLDGIAYLARENPDEHAAIQWLNANVQGSPILLEAPGNSFQAHTSRVSGYTGLPTLLGWRGHESQWRKNFTQAGQREADISEIYSGRNEEQTLALLDKYDISYIYVGSRERAQYSPAGLAKFDIIADQVFRQGTVTIYKRRR